jgi:hypothetical protein
MRKRKKQPIAGMRKRTKRKPFIAIKYQYFYRILYLTPTFLIRNSTEWKIHFKDIKNL